MAPLHPARTTCINVQAELVEVAVLVGLLPRHMPSSRWHAIDRRVRQRVRHFLSDAEWQRFARYARSRRKKAFERFVKRGLRCCGTLEGDPCPFGAKENEHVIASNSDRNVTCNVTLQLTSSCAYSVHK